MVIAVSLTAAFTGVLAVFAIVTAFFAIRAFRAQSRELGLLESQVKAQQQDREREAEEWRRDQAATIYVVVEVLRMNTSMGPEPTRVRARVHNTGRRPVYDVRVHWVDVSERVQLGDAHQLGTLGPGRDVVAHVPVEDVTSPERLVPVVFFLDSSSLRWSVLPDGHLAPVDAKLPVEAPLIAMTAVADASGDGKQAVPAE